jgi:predicted dehydrogenase
MNWGVIGYGGIAPTFLKSLKEFKDQKIYAVASRTNADKARADHPGAIVYEDYMDFYNDPDIDIVYIATTHNHHKTNAIKSLENGKHVLCEKPLAMNQNEVASIIKAARKYNRFLMEGMWTRFLPAYRKAMNHIQSGGIGEMRMIQASFAHKSKWGPERRLLNPELAGGSVLDAGIYPIALTQDFFREEPREIFAVQDKATTGVDASCAIIMNYPSGRIAQLHSSVGLKTNCSAMLYGTEGWIEIFNFLRSQQFCVSKNGERDIFEVPYISTGFFHEIEAVLQDIKAGRIENEVMSHKDSLTCSRIMDAVLAQFS